MSKISKICGVDAEAIAALLSLEIGELREKLAYESGHKDLSDWLEEDYEYEASDFEVDEDDIELYDEDDEDEDYSCDEDCYDDDDDYEDYDDEDDDEDTSLPSDQEELANQIARDIRDNKYDISVISDMYSDEFICRVIDLI